MAPASSSFPPDSRLKWKKRKRESNLGSNSNPKKTKPQEEDDDDENEEEEEPTVAGEEEEDQDLSGKPLADPVVDLRQSEVLSDGGQRVSDFPLVIKRSVNRPHSSVLAIVAAERWADARTRPRLSISLENISHGQLQVLSAVLPDNPSLNCQTEQDKPAAYVCTPPPLMEGKGVVKRFGNDHLLVVPLHSDWFNPNTVHRLERQVVPHFFSGKSSEHTPEKYMVLRNRIIAKCMENPGRRLSFGECNALVPASEIFDLSRIVRFLDHWGIINYLAVPRHRGPRISGSLIREETNGELQVTTAPLKSIDSLVQFDRPRSSYRPEDVSSLSSSASVDSNGEVIDLDSKIRERLSEHSCSCCSRPLLRMYYQSQKEVDTTICSDCFHDAKFVIGHSSLDFVRTDSTKDISDIDGESWSDQETFLLLEALEIYNDNWNEIAEHVGTKSKAQCILHFIRLPMEDSLLENIEFPHVAISSDAFRGGNSGISNASSNGFCLQEETSENRLPFASTRNPVMSMVAFLAAAIGPRVAATCASAALSVLTKEDESTEWMNSEGVHAEGGLHSDRVNLGHQHDETEDLVLHGKKDAGHASISPERVRLAAMFGLSAAAIKSKLFADQEEREIQRLSATIINHQLKRLELKLKQFAEVETLLMKECEQVERTRQRLSAERVRIMSTRFGQAGSATMPASAPAATAANTNPRQQGISLGGQVNMPGYGSNLPPHSQMPFLPRQPMFPFVGPRLPLSAIHPSSSPQSTNVMLPSGMSNAPTSNNHHPLLRSLSGNPTNLG